MKKTMMFDSSDKHFVQWLEKYGVPSSNQIVLYGLGLLS